MSDSTTGKFLLRLRELTVDSNGFFDMYKIREDVGLVDRIQTDHNSRDSCKGWIHR